MERSKVLKTVLIGTAAIYTLDFLDELRRMRSGQDPVWAFDTKMLSKAITVGVNPLMKVTAGDMVSHHPDFIEIPNRPDYRAFAMTISPTNNYTYTNFFRDEPGLLDYALAHSVLGIQEIGVLNPERPCHFAFQRDEVPGIWVSSKVIRQKIKILVDKPLSVLALEPGTLNPLSASLEGPFNRFDPRFREVRQF